MPTNVYFDTGTKPEQALYEDLMIEQLQIYGQDVYYIPRKMAGTNSWLVQMRFGKRILVPLLNLRTLLKCIWRM